MTSNKLAIQKGKFVVLVTFSPLSIHSSILWKRGISITFPAFSSFLGPRKDWCSSAKAAFKLPVTLVLTMRRRIAPNTTE
jgi:hypothetical protein